jgi:hypothetical protein
MKIETDAPPIMPPENARKAFMKWLPFQSQTEDKSIRPYHVVASI